MNKEKLQLKSVDLLQLRTLYLLGQKDGEHPADQAFSTLVDETSQQCRALMQQVGFHGWFVHSSDRAMHHLKGKRWNFSITCFHSSLAAGTVLDRLRNVSIISRWSFVY